MRPRAYKAFYYVCSPSRIALDRASALRSAIAELIIVFEFYNDFIPIFQKY